MSTVSKEIAEDIIAGKYDDDGATTIVQYKNGFDGKFAYGVTFGRQLQSTYMRASDFIRDPKLIWDYRRDGYKRLVIQE